MKVPARTVVIRSVIELVDDEKLKLNDHFKQRMRYNSDNDLLQIDLAEECTPEFVDALDNYLRTHKSTSVTDRTLIRLIENYRESLKMHVGTTVEKIEQLESALFSFFSDSSNKWVFEAETESGRMHPLYIAEIRYYPDEYAVIDRKRTLVEPAHVTMTTAYMHRGTVNSRRFTWYRKHIGSSATVISLLRQHGLTKETASLYKQYMLEVKKLQDLAPKTGKQMNASGYGNTTAMDRWYSTVAKMPMMIDGRMVKVVVDNEHEEGKFSALHTWSSSRNSSISNVASYAFWLTYTDKKKIKKGVSPTSEVSDDDSEYDTVVLPAWPYMKVFDLQRHVHVEMHVSDLHEYPWDKSAFDKLILPEQHKKLIGILVTGTNNLMEDIIQGKTGGIIVLATGKPGVGKTLTAEVYSEFIERPVYSVQCSQLGLNVDTVEKTLTTILKRAQRWNALLLLDEADVYIRHRGHDLHHNAIVGVFLRILEYYRGVLFMTSNLATVIDDAVLSRATAHIRYTLPTPDMQAQLWRVLGTQYGHTFTDEFIAKLVQEFVDVSGRDIKSMLKLATLMTKAEGSEVTLDLLNTVYLFQDTSINMAEGHV